MKKKLLFLTNLHNQDIEEDLFLSDYLGTYFDVKVCHPLECEKHLKNIDLVLIRNIWPVEDYRERLDEVFNVIKNRGIKTYPPLSAKGDMTGKEYLIELFNKGYPVIPTINNKEDLSKLGNTENYFIKPIYGGSSIGCKKVSMHELFELNLQGYVIQPFIDIEAELSLYFIDNKLQHALYTPNKEERWNLKPFTPTTEELAFAQQFVKWNNLPYGLQRIDACRMKDGRLLLMEIEDFCPFLSLLEIDKTLKDDFLDTLVKSLKKVVA
ncbi:MAG: hypothetical protein Q7R87_04295 [Nanoarchaeota archaeon]|nr:hypothetical protein [Nanoarchaeota archaeon]